MSLLPLSAAVLLTLAPAAAQVGDLPPPVAIRLRYVLGPGAKSCPPEQTLHDEVARRMGYDPFTPDAPDSVVTTLSLSARESRGTVEFHDTGDHRWDDKTLTFDGRNCMLLVTGVAIYISYMFAEFVPTPKAAPIPATPEPPPPPLPPPPPPPEPPPPKVEPPLKVELPRSEPVRLNLGIASALALRTASPPFAFNLAATAGLRYRSFSGALEFRWAPSEVAAVDTRGRELVRVTQYTGGVLPCGHYQAFFYCGVGQVTAVVGKGAPDTAPLSATTMVSAATGARLGADLLSVWKRRFALRLSADLLVTTRDVAIHFADTPAMDAGNTPAAWTTPRFSVVFGAGVVTDLSLK